MNDDNSKIMENMKSIQDQEKEQKNFLRQLLQKFSNKRGYFFAQKVKMGYLTNETSNNKHVSSYIAKHDLRYVAKNIKMGSDMPFMKNFRDPTTGKISVTVENIDELKQRAPDWSRQVQLTAYLIRNPNHKFTTILAVVQPDWFNDLDSDNWQDGVALKNAIEFESLDEEGSIGLLNLDKATVYALDGQHRIMGIKGLADLEGNKFAQKNKNDTRNRETFDLETFFKRMNETPDHSLVQKVLNEDISVEYIPAVVKGENVEDARRRIRNIFVSLNTNAKKPTPGELYLLNEEEGHVIAANRIATQHPMFNGGDRVNMIDTNLPPNTSPFYATLQSIATASFNYLVKHNGARQKLWYPKFKDLPGLRPNDEQIKEANEELKIFYDKLYEIQLFQTLEQHKDKQTLIDKRIYPKRDKGTKFENINWDDMENHVNKGHLLLRPIGPQILADAVGKLIYNNHGTLEDLFPKIYKMDMNNMFSAHLPKSIFFGVTYDPIKNNVDTNKQLLAANLIEYLLAGFTGVKGEVKAEEVMKSVVEGRTIDVESRKWINFDGKIVSLDDENETHHHKLPKPYK